MHCLVELIEGVFFANDLENNIAFSACCFDGGAQRFEIDHSSADWIMTPRFQTRIRNMHECNRFVMREQTRYGILLDPFAHRWDFPRRQNAFGDPFDRLKCQPCRCPTRDPAAPGHAHANRRLPCHR